MLQFAARLLAGVADATARGVEGVAVGCLNAREAGESVLKLPGATPTTSTPGPWAATPTSTTAS